METMRRGTHGPTPVSPPRSSFACPLNVAAPSLSTKGNSKDISEARLPPRLDRSAARRLNQSRLSSAVRPSAQHPTPLTLARGQMITPSKHQRTITWLQVRLERDEMVFRLNAYGVGSI